VRTFGSVQANHYLSQIHDSLRMVAENPGISLDACVTRLNLEKTMVRSHVAFFRIIRSPMDIVRILHGGMDFNRWH
jgi:plasmid stabilization system protein ParE